MARVRVGGAHEFPVRWDGRALHHSPVPTGDVVSVSDTPTGSLAAIVPGTFLGVGDRLAVLDLALMNLLDREYAADFGPLIAP